MKTNIAKMLHCNVILMVVMWQWLHYIIKSRLVYWYRYLTACCLWIRAISLCWVLTAGRHL